MWRMLQQEQPDDFVIATGSQHSVREFAERAFAANGMELRWKGEGVDEKSFDAGTGKLLVRVNPKWYRPTDVVSLLGDPAKARRVLGWDPQGTGFDELVSIMAGHDRALARAMEDREA